MNIMHTTIQRNLSGPDSYFYCIRGIPDLEVDYFRNLISRTISDELLDQSTNKSTRKGIQYELYPPPKKISSLVSFVQKQVTVTLKSSVELVSAWTIYGEENTYHSCHRHNTNDDICTVFYLDVNYEPNKDDGYLYFFKDGECHHHEPKKGDLLIFPATMYHGTYPQPPGQRQTLNMDFRRLTR